MATGPLVSAAVSCRGEGYLGDRSLSTCPWTVRVQLSVSQYHTVKYYILTRNILNSSPLLNMYITTFARGLSHCTSIIDPAFENLVLFINNLGPEDPLWPNAMQKHIGSIALPCSTAKPQRPSPALANSLDGVTIPTQTGYYP
jgi:hypothetical protein